MSAAIYTLNEATLLRDAAKRAGETILIRFYSNVIESIKSGPLYKTGDKLKATGGKH